MLSQQNRIMKLTGKIFNDFWRSHARTIGILVQALLLSNRAGIAAIGRHIPGSTSPKHKIKRVDYFLGQSKIDVLKASAAIAKWLIGSRQEIYVNIDWTKVRDWPVLVASIVYKGRSLPYKKCLRFGMGLGKVKVTTTERLERLMLIVVLAHIFAILIGEIVMKRGEDKYFRANTVTKKMTHSLFTLGMYYWSRLKWTLADFHTAFTRYQLTDVMAK